MGNLNQFNFVVENKNLVKGPILEIGGKDFGNTPNFRKVFPEHSYISIDQEDGSNVDVVADFTEDLAVILDKLPIKKFKTIINLSVLEHCRDPFKMCANITDLLDDDGVVFISAPFVWRIHAYPDDYWRFTPNGIRILFPGLDFDRYFGSVSTNVKEEKKPISNKMFTIFFSNLRSVMNTGKQSRFDCFLIYILRQTGLLNLLLKYPFIFPPTMVNMIGCKK